MHSASASTLIILFYCSLRMLHLEEIKYTSESDALNLQHYTSKFGQLKTLKLQIHRQLGYICKVCSYIGNICRLSTTLSDIQWQYSGFNWLDRWWQLSPIMMIWSKDAVFSFRSSFLLWYGTDLDHLSPQEIVYFFRAFNIRRLYQNVKPSRCDHIVCTGECS